jgi:tripeptidyl-peptidase-1
VGVLLTIASIIADSLPTSANGAWTHLYAGGELIREGGTSMSAPLVASIINLVRHHILMQNHVLTIRKINDERLNAGKTTVGFVNPTFYGNPTAFHDMYAPLAFSSHSYTDIHSTIGSNQGCGKAHAWNCTPGW